MTLVEPTCWGTCGRCPWSPQWLPAPHSWPWSGWGLTGCWRNVLLIANRERKNGLKPETYTLYQQHRHIHIKMILFFFNIFRWQHKWVPVKRFLETVDTTTWTSKHQTAALRHLHPPLLWWHSGQWLWLLYGQSPHPPQWRTPSAQPAPTAAQAQHSRHSHDLVNNVFCFLLSTPTHVVLRLWVGYLGDVSLRC